MSDQASTVQPSQRYIQATIWMLLLYAREYKKPASTEAEQDVFWRDFLEAHPRHRCRRLSSGQYTLGDLYTPESLKDAVLRMTTRNSDNFPRITGADIVARLCSSTDPIFPEKYKRTCQKAYDSENAQSSGAVVRDPQLETSQPDGNQDLHCSGFGQIRDQAALRRSASFEPVHQYEPVDIDQSRIEEAMQNTEKVRRRYCVRLNDAAWNTSNYTASPGMYLQHLYRIVFGSDFQVSFAKLQRDRLATNLDVVFALTGAALYRDIFQAKGGFLSAAVVVQNLCAALDEHMAQQRFVDSSPTGWVDQDIRDELVSMFEAALDLKKKYLMNTTEIQYLFHRPGDFFNRNTMVVLSQDLQPNFQPVSPTPGQVIAMCLLPKIETLTDKGSSPLYKARVRLNDGVQRLGGQECS